MNHSAPLHTATLTSFIEEVSRSRAILQKSGIPCEQVLEALEALRSIVEAIPDFSDGKWFLRHSYDSARQDARTAAENVVATVRPLHEREMEDNPNDKPRLFEGFCKEILDYCQLAEEDFLSLRRPFPRRFCLTNQEREKIPEGPAPRPDSLDHPASESF